MRAIRAVARLTLAPRVTSAHPESPRWLASSGFEDIQPAHLAAIQPLWDLPDSARVTTLARAARITKQSMSALVHHLEETGYVEHVEHTLRAER